MQRSVLYIRTADEAETVFYESFMRCDIDVMAALWSDGDVVCVHPGSGVIIGHDAVVRSWRHILENASPTDIRYTAINKHISNDLAVHLVTEEILNKSITVAVVVATNVYRKYEQGWLMIEHHGSLVQQNQKDRTLQ